MSRTMRFIFLNFLKLFSRFRVILSEAKDLALDSSAFGLRMTLVLGILVIKISPAWAWNSEDQRIFLKANQDYQKAKFQEAANGYKQLAEKHSNVGIFFFDLGNSLYRLGSIGSSLLAYERALALDPRNEDLRYNLNYVRGQLEFKMEDKRNWYLKFLDGFLRFFKSEEIIFLAGFIFLLFISTWVFSLFFRPNSSWGTGRKGLLVLSLISIGLASLKQGQSRFMSDAIVMQKDAEVRFGPSDSDQIAFKLGEGLKVYVVDRREDWSRVFLTNGETGWMKNSQITEVHQ